MIEVYVILTLLGVGYFVNQNRPVSTSAARQINVNELPTATTRYESNHTKVANAIETAKAQRMVRDVPNVIPKMSIPAPPPRNQNITSQLAGVEIPKEQFVHNNMVPFFRGAMRQYTDPNSQAHQSTLEAFTGVSDYYAPKREQEPLFDMSKNLTHIHGAPQVDSDRLKDRIAPPTLQNNVLPFQQVRVGPGLKQGFTDRPTGGFQQFDVQELARPKTVDELRVATNPKTTYNGRIIDGQKGVMRGKIGRMEKNRADTFFENNPDRYLKTTGAVIKATQHGKYTDKPTARQCTSRDYKGVAYNNKELPYRSKVRAPHRNQLNPFSLTNLSLSKTGRRDDYDYGKSTILVYNNERDVTSTRTYQGNLTSIVKAIVAPIEDIFKITKKEYMVDAPRLYGQMKAQVPSKLTVQDPNDIMRTTIKETTLSEADLLNLKGATQVTVFDPDQVARTTIKETVLNESEAMNIRGPTKAVIYDPNDTTRVTIKETTLHDADISNLKGAVRTHVYDPNDIARVTNKETMIHDAELTNLRGDRTMGYVYDHDVKAKATVRQTLPCVDTEINMAVSRFAGNAYDPDNHARTTVRETTLDGDYVGIIDRADHQQGAYTDENFEMKQTHKEYLSNREYMGGVTNAHTDGYKVAPTDMKATLKEDLEDIEYFGNAADQSTRMGMSYEDMYNACISELKESTLKGRDPTKQGSKQAIGSEGVRMETRRIASDEPNARMMDNQDRVINQPQQINIESLTRNRNVYDNTEYRLDMDITTAKAIENPFTIKPLSSGQF